MGRIGPMGLMGHKDLDDRIITIDCYAARFRNSTCRFRIPR